MRNTKITTATPTKVRGPLTTGSVNEPTSTTGSYLAKERTAKRNADFEKLLHFLGGECDVADFCECLTEIERRYSSYALRIGADCGREINEAAVNTVREIIDRARIGFDLISFSQFVEGRGATHAALLRDLRMDYTLFLIGDETARGSNRTMACVDLLDELIDLLAEIGD